MNRVIKFRSYDKVNDIMYSFEELTKESALAGVIGLNNAGHEKIAVMQFSGKSDRKGVDIYEGDVMSSDKDKEYDCIVKFEDGSFWRELITASHPFYKEVTLSSAHYHDESWEVIGNIYKNPELLITNHKTTIAK